MSNLATIFAAISATASATAAFGALSQVRKAAQGSEANAYLQLMDRYSSAEMRDLIIDLSNLWRAAQTHDEAVSDTYVRFLETDKIEAQQIYNHCRRVSAYFVDATRLFKAGLISRKVLVMAIAHPGLNSFYEVVVPLNRLKAGSHNSVWAAGVLKDIMPVHGSGMY